MWKFSFFLFFLMLGVCVHAHAGIVAMYDKTERAGAEALLHERLVWDYISHNRQSFGGAVSRIQDALLDKADYSRYVYLLPKAPGLDAIMRRAPEGRLGAFLVALLDAYNELRIERSAKESRQ